MTQSKDPLSSLLAGDAKAADRQKLAELLKPFTIIDKDSKEFSFLPAFEDIDGNTVKIEIALAASKARALLFNEPEGLSSGEIILLGIMAEGSVKSSLKKLYDTHKIKKDKDGRYFLPSYRIGDLIKQFTIEK